MLIEAPIEVEGLEVEAEALGRKGAEEGVNSDLMRSWILH